MGACCDITDAILPIRSTSVNDELGEMVDDTSDIVKHTDRRRASVSGSIFFDRLMSSLYSDVSGACLMRYTDAISNDLCLDGIA